MVKKHFDVGDLVWAKMKYFPFWPGKIVESPTDVKPSAHKKAQHYVFFFGSENYAFIKDKYIEYHSEEMLLSASSKKKSNSLKLAIKQITEVAPKKIKLEVIEMESPKKSREISTNAAKKEVVRVQRIKVKTESHKVGKKLVSKRSVKNKRKLPPRKLSKRPTGESSEVINDAPPDIRPLEQPHHSSATSSEIARNDHIKLEQDPTLNLHKPTRARIYRLRHKKIGFIGLGKMGQMMVKRLLTSNHDVTIWNRTYEKCRRFLQFGAKLALTPADLVQDCDIIFCRVSGPEASKSIVFGEAGILLGLENSPPGSKGYVEMTTMDSTTSIRIAEAITHYGGRYLEATACGTKTMTQTGNLLILSAGDPELFIDCESCFSSFSRHARHLSCEVGHGSNMNLIYSMMIGITHIALAESISFVKRCNLNPITFLEIVEGTPLASPLLSDIGESLLSGAVPNDPSNVISQQKDFELVLSLADSCDQRMYITTVANELFKRAKLRHYPDISHLYSLDNY